jgi:hypothetical protein
MQDFPQTFNHKSIKPTSISHKDQPEIGPSTTLKSQSKSLSININFSASLLHQTHSTSIFPTYLHRLFTSFFTTLCNNVFAKAMVPLCLLFALHSLTPTTQKTFSSLVTYIPSE